MLRTATCSCGQLAAACEGEPISVSLCHCIACQKRTGSAFGIAAFFERGAVTVTGASGTYRRASESGFDVTFHFCPECGSSVFWEPARKLDMIAIASGAFGDPAFPKPSQQVFTDCRHGWVRIAL